MQLSDEERFCGAQNGTFRGFEKETNLNWKGPFRFIQCADTQFGFIDELANVDWNDFDHLERASEESKKYKSLGRAKWDREIHLATLAIKQWNNLSPKPRFVIVCGDLINDFPGESQQKSQLIDFKKVFHQLDTSIPLILVPGNHDILNQPTSTSIEAWKQEFGDDYFRFWVDGVLFIVINVQYFKDGRLVPELAQKHEKWLEETLEEVEKEREIYKHVVVFQHIPWFLKDIDEDDNRVFNISKELRQIWINKFQQSGIRAIFTGHYHRNAGGHFKDLELVVTSAMGGTIKDPETGIIGRSGYRVVEVGENKLEHHFVEIEPLIRMKVQKKENNFLADMIQEAHGLEHPQKN